MIRPGYRPAAPGSTPFWAGASMPTACICTRAVRAPARPRSHLQFLLEGAGGANGFSTSPFRKPARASAGGAAPRLVVSKTSTCSNSYRRRPRSIPTGSLTVFHPAGVELGETTKIVLERVQAAQSDARRVRQPVGTSSARAEPFALSASGAGSQAFLRQPPMHRHPSR